MTQKYLQLSRIAAISDGVFAIAMTLLVLDLKVPEFEGVLSASEFRAVLATQVPSFFAWLVSFALLCRLWITQHALLNGGEKRSRAFVAVNFVFLGVVSFIAFPTALLSEHPDQALSVVIFSACYVVAGLSLGGMWFLLEARQGEGTKRPEEVERSAKRVIIGIPLVALCACLLALFVNPYYGLALWVTMPFIGMGAKLHKRHASKKV